MVKGDHSLVYQGTFGLPVYCLWSKEITHTAGDYIYYYDGICTEGNPPYSCTDCNPNDCLDLESHREGDDWEITKTYILVKRYANEIRLEIRPNTITQSTVWNRHWDAPTEGRCMSAGGLTDLIGTYGSFLDGGTGHIEGYP